VFLSGCTVLKNRNVNNLNADYKLNAINVINRLESQNISNNSFFIQKADIEVISENGNMKFVGSVKFVKPDKYLISLRSRSGIEGARIFITKDTILANDRINQKLYFGKPAYLKIRYSIVNSEIPVIFGDYITDNKDVKSNEDCKSGYLTKSYSIKGLKVNYYIDCTKGKVKTASIESNVKSEATTISFTKFTRKENICIPGKISIMYRQPDMTINIKVERIEYPWNGDIEFIPGKKYELIELI
jgi:hypothetical protein